MVSLGVIYPLESPYPFVFMRKLPKKSHCSLGFLHKIVVNCLLISRIWVLSSQCVDERICKPNNCAACMLEDFGFGKELLSPNIKQTNMADDSGNKKWHGSVGGLVEAPIDKVWDMVSQTSRLQEWMPMVERCTDLAGDEGVPGYVRLVSGFMFPQQDGDRSWIKERLVFMNPSSHSYVYRMEASNVGLDGSVNSLKLVDYGRGSTLVDWRFEINPLEGACEDTLIDYLGFLYKSCINRIEGAIEASAKNV